MIGSYEIGGRGVRSTDEDFSCIFVMGGTATLMGRAFERGQGVLLGAARFFEEGAALPRAYLRLDFSERELLRAFGEHGIRADGVPFGFEADESFERTARFFFDRSTEISSTARALALTDLFLSYARQTRQEDAASAAEGYVRHTERYIREHLSEPIQVDAIAEDLGISRGYLRNVFFAVHGMSPREYLTSERLRRAEELLREGGLTVTEVAARVGYEDVLQFSRIFKKHTGSSPSGYREENGGAPVRREAAPAPQQREPKAAEPRAEEPKPRKKDPVWLF